MFTGFGDWILMLLAVALGVAAAKYIPALVKWSVKQVSAAADKVGGGDDG